MEDQFDGWVMGCKKKSAMLQSSLLITKDMAESDAVWRSFKTLYNKRDELTPDMRVAISVMNALYGHQRFIFCLTKRNLGSIVQSDMNWGQAPTYTSNDYPSQLFQMYSMGINRVTDAGIYSKTAGIFRVTERNFLFRHICVDVAQQLKEALEFAKPEEHMIKDLEFRNSFHDIFSVFKSHHKNNHSSTQEKEEERERETKYVDGHLSTGFDNFNLDDHFVFPQ